MPRVRWMGAYWGDYLGDYLGECVYKYLSR